MSKVQMIITLRCVVRTMVKHSEYMEAFFGVELNQKFEDMINELKDAEDNLKELSLEIGKLGEIKDADTLSEYIKECRAVAYENAQSIKDVRTFLDFYLKSDKTSTHIILERDAYMKIYQIFKWDGADVRDLKRWIGDLKEICDKIGLNMRDLINFKKLTSQPVPPELVKFPVYALDRQGYCLTGPAFDMVLHIDEVREQMGENSN
ncbi:MAG: hypothetical protein WCE65_02360 [Methanoregula sp.]